MDNIRFGAFVAQLRKEQGLTQKELADRLNVTDKAVSKWETGKGFPDVKLLEPLAQALGISLVELIRGEKDPRDSLTAAEAEASCRSGGCCFSGYGPVPEDHRPPVSEAAALAADLHRGNMRCRPSDSTGACLGVILHGI